MFQQGWVGVQQDLLLLLSIIGSRLAAEKSSKKISQLRAVSVRPSVRAWAGGALEQQQQAQVAVVVGRLPNLPFPVHDSFVSVCSRISAALLHAQAVSFSRRNLKVAISRILEWGLDFYSKRSLQTEKGGGREEKRSKCEVAPQGFYMALLCSLAASLTRSAAPGEGIKGDRFGFVILIIRVFTGLAPGRAITLTWRVQGDKKRVF